MPEASLAKAHGRLYLGWVAAQNIIAVWLSSGKHLVKIAHKIYFGSRRDANSGLLGESRRPFPQTLTWVPLGTFKSVLHHIICWTRLKIKGSASDCRHTETLCIKPWPSASGWKKKVNFWEAQHGNGLASLIAVRQKVHLPQFAPPSMSRLFPARSQSLLKIWWRMLRLSVRVSKNVKRGASFLFQLHSKVSLNHP